MERGLQRCSPPETPVGGFIVFVREKPFFTKVLTRHGAMPRRSEGDANGAVGERILMVFR